MKPKIIILEGHRLTGKSTVAKILRENINYVTLVNPTGFPDKGPEGLRRISDYYDSWVRMIADNKDGNVFLFDRFFFSELVFSTLYKDYDFNSKAKDLLRQLTELADVYLYLLRVEKDETLEKRQGRVKVQFAGIADSQNEIFKQRDEYDKLLPFIVETLGEYGFYDMTTRVINTDDRTPPSIADSIMLHQGVNQELRDSKKKN